MLSPPVLGIFDRQDWVRSWNQAPELLQRIAALAQSFLVTFPIGLNVAWRNNWEMDMGKKHGGNINIYIYTI